MTYTQSDATERWNQNADAWHRVMGEHDPNRKDLLDPLILRLLGDLPGKEVLDAGCGDGYLARKLARLGATVTGVEAARSMLAFALEEQQQEPLSITYNLGDVTSMPFLADRRFDVVVTNNVIQDVEDFQGAFREFNRVLRPGGTYLHIENHPCYSLQGTGWVRDAQGEQLYRKVDYYFNRSPFIGRWSAESGIQGIVQWHRTLGDIVNSLISAGFTIAQLIEPEPPESWRDNPRINDAFRIPDFIALLCKKG